MDGQNIYDLSIDVVTITRQLFTRYCNPLNAANGARVSAHRLLSSWSI